MSQSRYRFELATAADDGALRQRMAEDWMRGSLSLSFRREPSYFAGCDVQGERAQVILCRDLDTDAIVGMGSRCERTTYVNGVAQRTGYLCDLRAHPAVRSRTLLARGFRFLGQLHDADPIPLYTTVIFEGNTAALGALTGGRAGLPQYREYGRVLTPAIYLDLPKRAIREPGLRFQTARPAQMADVAAFLNSWHSRKQFAPVFDAAALGTPRLRGLAAGDFLLAFRNERIVACCAAWEQRSFRQTHIERYTPGLARLRPLYNIAARLSPLKPLPAPGAEVPYFYLSFAAAEDNDVRLFRPLLRELHRRRRTGPWHYFIAGFHETDPLAAALADYRRIETAGRLFVVHYHGEEAGFGGVDPERIPYIEMATV